MKRIECIIQESIDMRAEVVHRRRFSNIRATCEMSRPDRYPYSTSESVERFSSQCEADNRTDPKQRATEVLVKSFKAASACGCVKIASSALITL
ncbi:hypothetical protein P0R31_37055 [Bradyrhizobium yuanmingense]|uniref:hypothetical protein n=1 Tax=Bradyrhizobium yuanmingense TaxID=108015 RepID=UPI0023B8C926|nr:hypothetical protein [Bradyrhizobium yuanmingense]MDF0522848.1 hypothetical protein [Bradyrhizobium yuanmingense]